MTSAEFTTFYPWFSGLFPSVVLEDAVTRANARFADFGADTEAARRLFAAHLLTLYADAALPEGAAESLQELASAGTAPQTISSQKVGDVAVSYAAGGSSGETSFKDLSLTAYGTQLLGLLKLHSRTKYVP